MQEQLNAFIFAGGFSLLTYAIIAGIGLVTLGSFAFWIWMIIDCAKRNFPQGEENSKIVWILVLIFVGWIGALIYLLVVKLPQDKKLKAQRAVMSPRHPT